MEIDLSHWIESACCLAIALSNNFAAGLSVTLPSAFPRSALVFNELLGTFPTFAIINRPTSVIRTYRRVIDVIVDYRPLCVIAGTAAPFVDPLASEFDAVAA